MASRLDISRSSYYLKLRTDQEWTLKQLVDLNEIGRSDLSSAFMTISPAGDWTTDVTATIKGADDATLGSVLVSAIPMGRNKSTTINGSILTGSAAFGLTINDAWLDPEEISF